MSDLIFSRRFFLAAAAAVLCAAPLAAQAQSTTKVDVKELLAPHPLGERSLGDEKAPVTIVEYYALTCSHCAHFHKDIFPQLKANYIDTGKVRIIFREYWFDGIAKTEAALARCSGDKYFAVADFFFDQQKALFESKAPKDTLKVLAKQMGFGDAAFNQCVTDEKVVKGINTVFDEAEKKFGVQSTPTFFVNGETLVGALPYEDFVKVIERHLVKK